jgi:hypothetical protein
MNDESFIIIHPLYIHLRSSFQNTNPIAHKITFQLTSRISSSSIDRELLTSFS